ncbi:MAG: arginine--tRNA ligase [Melioribacteraceae bacterium]|nr:MAG: arginine--tRNA ligase [Melioribacteraceae bacterium]
MKNLLADIFEAAKKELPYLEGKPINFSIPNREEHGDYSTNIAMLLTKELKKKPRQIAQEIIDALDLNPAIVTKTEIAGPGFINFYMNKNYLANIIGIILEEKSHFGKSDKYSGKRANVEFVSANPTGPLTVGHGRNAVIGDTVSNMLEWVGYEVDREYYFNNAGRQMRVLGESVKIRCQQLLGEEIEFPDDHYQGEYIIDIAKKILAGNSNDISSLDDKLFKETAEKEIFADIEKTLAGLNIKMKVFFNENTLYEDGKIEGLLEQFKEKALSYEKEGAIWLKLSELGNEQDKVIVKSTGEPTYRLPDMAYHITKLDRKYDLIIDLFGSDHMATYPDVMAGVKSLGYDIDRIKVLIYQFVTLMQGGEVVKMSTRKANFVTLDELVEEVGADVVRYFFVMRSINTHLNFDLELAKKQSDENPVFYLQYAHARIASILRMTKEEKLEISLDHLNLLNHEAEVRLLKKLNSFRDDMLYAVENLEPQKVSNYLEELAALFHRFYTECRIIGSEKNLAEARIALVNAVKIVLANGLGLLGLSAPDRM